MDSSKWILAKKKGAKEGDDKYMFRLPLRALAPKGDIESQEFTGHNDSVGAYSRRSIIGQPRSL